MTNKFKINDLVKYNGVEVKAYNLFPDSDYTVTQVNSEGAISINHSQLFFHPDQFTLVEAKSPRQMKFSDKPGSAVVYYKSGAKFHISRLVTIELGYVNGETCISVERDYFQDGIYFSEAACIPVDIFDKLVYVTKDHDVVNDLVTVTYDPEIKYLVRGISNKFLRLDLEL